MDDEPTLPRLSWNPLSETFSNQAPRKRVRLHDSPPPLSSDPAIFSSDDDPSADNYVPGRRKKQYRGPWFKQESCDEYMEDTPPNEKRPRAFKRQMDSGVWMGSDGTDSDLGDLPAPSASQSFSYRGSQQAVQLSPVDEHIHECLEYGNEAVDLS
jgi:hypothetical protein